MNKLSVYRMSKRTIVKKTKQNKTINLSNTTLTSKTDVETDDNADMDSYPRHEYKNISELTLTVIIIILLVCQFSIFKYGNQY